MPDPLRLALAIDLHVIAMIMILWAGYGLGWDDCMKHNMPVRGPEGRFMKGKGR